MQIEYRNIYLCAANKCHSAPDTNSIKYFQILFGQKKITEIVSKDFGCIE